ncbi:MAG: DNA polymerase [Armatimonadetes bacterium]|nr:DNA polymerase [Armatimonadota bacterium]
MVDANTVLFGSDPTERIVAVEPKQEGISIYRRENGRIAIEERPAMPWLLTSQRMDLPGASWTELEGEGYRHMARFPNWTACRAARFKLRDEHISNLAFPSPAKQYMILSGRTLFKGMAYSDVHRLQLDIETLGLSPDHPGNGIFMIALSDNRGGEWLLEGREKDILESLVRLVQDLDPDVIEGHNILGFDLPYIARRADLCGVGLHLGRDGSAMEVGQEKSAAIGGISRPVTPFHIHGRHIIDTLIGVQRYDVARGALSSHGLKECARALGIECADRVYIPHQEIASAWKSDPERVKRYALHDVIETRALSELVGPSEFYLTQMVSDVYSSVATTGTGEKINSILIREYLRRGCAIPRPQQPKEITGGYTDVKLTGLIERVVKCDVESLYPSLMLTQRIKPASDTLDVFLPALEELTRRRFEAKAKAKSSSGSERAYWDGLQSSFKILINSFYGYLGAVAFNFNDYDAAERITTAGQATVKQISQELERTGSKVIEIDTDGVYFQPPPGVDGEEAESSYIEQIGGCLPQGIRLAHDGRYRAMLSLKVKNYVLVGYGGERIFRGASLRSRAEEVFGREFISEAVELLVGGEKERVSELYRRIADDISAKRLPLEKFVRRERITEKTFTSDSKKRLADAAKGRRVGDYINVYEREDGTIGPAESYANDEDTKYLLDRLYKFACRLREAFGGDFEALFPRPSAKTAAEAAGQQTLF